MADSRAKGAGYEREVASRLLGLTGITFKRDLEQYRATERGDLIPSDPAWPFVIECKRYATGTGCKPAWRAQATKAADAVQKFPAVIYRFDRREDRVSVPLEAIFVALGDGHVGTTEWAEITIEGLAFLAAEIMAAKAQHHSDADRGESPRDRSSRQVGVTPAIANGAEPMEQTWR